MYNESKLEDPYNSVNQYFPYYQNMMSQNHVSVKDPSDMKRTNGFLKRFAKIENIAILLCFSFGIVSFHKNDIYVSM